MYSFYLSCYCAFIYLVRSSLQVEWQQDRIIGKLSSYADSGTDRSYSHSDAVMSSFSRRTMHVRDIEHQAQCVACAPTSVNDNARIASDKRIARSRTVDYLLAS